jgi:hypothetical protein
VSGLPAGDYVITTSQSYDPVIAAVPLMALVGLAAFLAFYLLRLAEGVLPLLMRLLLVLLPV